MINPHKRPWLRSFAGAWLFFALGLVLPASAESFYISRNGSDGDGRSWSSAWSEFDRIRWKELEPGDVVLIDGGESEMTYRTRFETRRGGEKGAPIIFRRADEPGRNGKVYMKNQLDFTHPWVIFDGGDRNLFDFTAGGGYAIHFDRGSDHCEVRNLYVHGDYSGPWGVSLAIFSNDVVVHGCTFKDSPYEDQVFINLGSGTFEFCDFIGLEPDPDTSRKRAHRDVMSLVIPEGRHAVVRYCRFRNVKTTGCILALSGAGGAALKQGRYEIYYNIFEGMPNAVKFDPRIESLETCLIYNNLFRDTTSTTGQHLSSFIQLSNNIFSSSGKRRQVFNGVGRVDHNLWEGVAIRYFPGRDNLRAQPDWADPESGDYHLREGSPAIDAGRDLGQKHDFDGRLIVGPPDIGPYEFDSSQLSIEELPPRWDSPPGD